MTCGAVAGVRAMRLAALAVVLSGLAVSGCAKHSAAHLTAATPLAHYHQAGSAETARLHRTAIGERVPDNSGRRLVRLPDGFKPDEIIVSFGDRRLYYVTRRGEAISYPIAIPRDQDRWEGVTRVSDKKENPSWTPTPSMIAENPRLPRWVPGGHELNPLGVRALYLGESMYRIHGTDAPWTIGSAVSKGCIRMLNQDVLDLYPRVQVGGHVTVTWERIAS